MEKYLIVYEDDSFFYTENAVDLKDCMMQFATDTGVSSSLLSKALKGMETTEEIITLFSTFSRIAINKIVKVEKTLYNENGFVPSTKEEQTVKDNAANDIESDFHEGKVALSTLEQGKEFKLGNHEYIALCHNRGATEVVAKDIVARMIFGKTGDYTKSDVREYCNVKFYKELVEAVGAENILLHKVNLVCDDGSNKGEACVDNVSILTNEKYRRYREYLPALGEEFWTATGVTTLDKDFDNCLCLVGKCGVIVFNKCNFTRGVRPFFVLKSSVLVRPND